MADISKCNDNLCPSKEYCYRFTVQHLKYFNFMEYSIENKMQIIVICFIQMVNVDTAI